MTVKFSKEKPPIYGECVKRFGVNWNKGVIFTYGDTIHCKHKISKPKIAHEKTHVKQQLDYGVENWWYRYFEDDQFRLDQEIEAYKSEIVWINQNLKGLKLKQDLIEQILFDLSSSMYGSIVTYQEARNLLGI